MDLAALSAAIEADPRLAAFAAEGRDPEIADVLNAEHPSARVPRIVSAGELPDLIGPANMPKEGTPEHAYVLSLLALRSFTANVANLEAAVPGVNWPLLVTRPATWAEFLLGEPVAVGHVSEVYAAEREAAYRKAQEPLDAAKAALDAAVADRVLVGPERRAAIQAAQDAIRRAHADAGTVLDGPTSSILVGGVRVEG